MLATLALAAADAGAVAPVTVPATDPSPTVSTRPTLVSVGQVVRISVNSPSPITPLRFKVYPDSYGFQPTNSACQGQFYTPYVRTSRTGRVVITLTHPKPLCRGLIYQAEALIGTGDVPDKFAHLCVRGRSTPTSQGCADSLGG